MSLSVFEMCSVELYCQRPLGARYVICNEQHYKVCLRKAADLEKAKADTREFLGIAGLNRREWEKDGNLVRSIQKRGWLWLRGVRDRNPDTDGWWVINALLSEVRRGSLLAIKGPRADLFPRPHGTPLRTLPASAVYLPDGEPRLSGQYDPGTRQGRLVAARAAMASSSLHDAAVAVVGTLAGGNYTNADSAHGSDPAHDGDTSTLSGNAQPFKYTPDTVSRDAEYLAGIGNRGDMYACDIISAECKGSVLREFPGQYLDSTLNDIQNDAQDGVKDARKALKLLNDGRFKK
ncbi:hypothetical protein [Paraburkholderia susongensis]|uniref:Uncharacterized protein n=1 Tax=Paraburkholderia susongensis TaxID=1515439 RepID=A0A1X7KV27_9BURK|nr:hypothetical protein [Paraburkholderia susongensis]SMG45164.1 hypothetical protein SAMN06265784_104347 [Paraburkholderia susongensis]